MASIIEPISTILCKKRSAHLGFWVNSVLTRNGCIGCLIQVLLLRKIILQQMDELQTEIQSSLKKLSAFNVSTGVTPQKLQNDK